MALGLPGDWQCGAEEAGGDSDMPLSATPSPVDTKAPGKAEPPPGPPGPSRFQPPSSLLLGAETLTPLASEGCAPLWGLY